MQLHLQAIILKMVRLLRYHIIFLGMNLKLIQKRTIGDANRLDVSFLGKNARIKKIFFQPLLFIIFLHTELLL